MLSFAKNWFLRRRFGIWSVVVPKLWRNREKIRSATVHGADRIGVPVPRFMRRKFTQEHKKHSRKRAA